MNRVLVVGAGFAGATYARVLAEAGCSVTVIDQRKHVGGNAYDETDATGTRVHRYGPHLFHTSNPRVIDWVQRFADWTPYQLRVRALVDLNKYVPLPINRHTIEAIHGVVLSTAEETEQFLRSVSLSIRRIESAEDFLLANVGPQITNLLFRPYTRKMWGLDLNQLSAAVVKRIAIRYDCSDLYFPDDTFQALPSEGYHAFFQSILDHPLIEVRCSEAFDPAMRSHYDCTFTSAAIDDHFEFCFGELPYRSIRFVDETRPQSVASAWPITNFTDNGEATRETDWSMLPHHKGGGKDCTVTREYPCDYNENGYERYYPVKTADDRFGKIYERYKALAEKDDTLFFIGRCGTYQYLDMHQVINQSMLGAEHWLRSRS